MTDTERTIHITEDLLSVLLDNAAEAEPEQVNIALATTSGTELVGDGAVDLGDVPVFTHFYLPEAGSATNAVFGVDLSISPGQTHGRFLSHPDGHLDLSTTDELHAIVFVAVPPWTADDLAVFDRSGRRQSLKVLDAEPPEESLP
jgi:hypothetical protein